jgi:uncharacterized protein (TIGR02996 family)
MTTEEQLLLQLKENPPDGLDDVPRLIYADWLEEDGGPDETTLAELLRLRAELGARPGSDARRAELAARETVLLQGHGTSWHTSRRRRFLLAAPFTRSKPHVNIGTIGHHAHGKTALTAAIMARLAHRNRHVPLRTWEELAAAGKEGGLVHAEYQSQRRHYAHIDCSGRADRIKNMLTSAFQMDGAILVVAANDGPMPQTREHICLARCEGLTRW